MKHGSRRRWLWAVCAGVFAGACLSPTLPLPPPSDPELESDGQGRWQLSGSVGEPGVRVVATNWRTNLLWGQLTVGNGRYAFWIEAETGDVVELWYELGDERSQSNLIVIPQAPGTGVGGEGGLGGASGAGGLGGAAGEGGLGGAADESGD